MAALMALVALSIDAMLPALSEIGEELLVRRDNDVQLVVSLLFFGLAVGQIGYGPLSDAIGRKPAIFLGLSLFIVGCGLSTFATSFRMMLVGRTLQGLGAAGPRVVSVAVIRDCYEGREMARVLSFVMAVFILVPVLAPALGQAVLLVSTWRTIFAVFIALAIVVALWLGVRQPETLSPERRIPFTFERIVSGIREVMATRDAAVYTIAAGLVFGAFLGYLNSAQQLLQGLYGVGTLFPLYFAVLSLAIGAASLLNARLVVRYGMKPLARRALWLMGGLSAVFYVVASSYSGVPPLPLLVAYLLVVFFCDGILYSNMNALAMEPLGHIAGMGAAVVGTVSLFVSLLGGMAIGQAYDGTVLPLVVGFGVLGGASLLVMRWAESEVPSRTE